MGKNQFASWEKGFNVSPAKDSGRNARLSFEFDSLGRERTLFTRRQWRAKGRRVEVRDEDSVKSITTNSGNQLRLFSFEQTIEWPTEAA